MTKESIRADIRHQGGGRAQSSARSTGSTQRTSGNAGQGERARPAGTGSGAGAKTSAAGFAQGLIVARRITAGRSPFKSHGLTNPWNREADLTIGIEWIK